MKAHRFISLLIYVSQLPQASTLIAVEKNTDLEIVHLANPASVYCGEQGGTLEIKSDRHAAQYGLCHLPDGSVCEEWAFFRDNICINPEENGAPSSH